MWHQNCYHSKPEVGMLLFRSIIYNISSRNYNKFLKMLAMHHELWYHSRVELVKKPKDKN